MLPLEVAGENTSLCLLVSVAPAALGVLGLCPNLSLVSSGFLLCVSQTHSLDFRPRVVLFLCSYLNDICKDPISQYSHILRLQGHGFILFY